VGTIEVRLNYSKLRFFYMLGDCQKIILSGVNSNARNEDTLCRHLSPTHITCLVCTVLIRVLVSTDFRAWDGQSPYF
jgi:hypothetical protein